MASTTANYGFRKPETTDLVNVELDIADNMDAIDETLATKSDDGHTHADMATDAEVTAAVAALVDAAPASLDTLNELAAALADDANYASTITTALAAKASTADLTTHAADTSTHGFANGAALLDETAHDLLDHTGLTGVGTAGIAAAVAAHEADTTAVHGITDTSTLSLNTHTHSTITANRQTASYTLVAGDAGKVIEMNVGSANNLTVPPNTDVAFATGTVIEALQYGAGQTTIVAGVGVTIRSPGAKLKIAVQYGSACLRKIATDEWAFEGNIST